MVRLPLISKFHLLYNFPEYSFIYNSTMKKLILSITIYDILASYFIFLYLKLLTLNPLPIFFFSLIFY